MPKQTTTLAEVLEEQLKDLYSAENQLAKAMPKLAKAAHDPDLKKGLEAHLETTKEQIERLKSICEELQIKPTGKKCAAAAGLVEESTESLEENATPEIKDVMIIADAQRSEHYEIAGYTSAIALAEALGHDSVVELLSTTLSEEEECNDELSDAAKKAIAAADAAGDDDEEDEDEESEEEEEEEEEENDEETEKSEKKK